MGSQHSTRQNLAAKMRRHFFDLSPDNVLLYVDPMIGELRNPRWSLVVRLAGSGQALELCHEGQPVERFDLIQSIKGACTAAFLAYYELLELLCAHVRALHG